MGAESPQMLRKWLQVTRFLGDPRACVCAAGSAHAVTFFHILLALAKFKPLKWPHVQGPSFGRAQLTRHVNRRDRAKL
jgi:hypothetical protein